jgi:hypothetical protein
MIQELWGMFPRLLERNINGLLDHAEPNSTRAFQLYKTCKNSGLWEETFERFTTRLEEFFSLPKFERRKSHFDNFLNRPMDHSIYQGFHLNFRTAVVPEKSINDLASWAHNLIRVSKQTATAVISLDVMTKTLKQITTPGLHDKAENIEFEDFCGAWKKTVFRLFGIKHDAALGALLAELRWINAQLKESDRLALEKDATLPMIYLTQTETDWTHAVRQAVLKNMPIPKFPLARGPEKLCLMELDRIISLHKILQISKRENFIQHRESVRLTILDRCDRLLGQVAA